LGRATLGNNVALAILTDKAIVVTSQEALKISRVEGVKLFLNHIHVSTFPFRVSVTWANDSAQPSQAQAHWQDLV
jgi:hypothetical protein